jgi:hypothetical protein
MFRVATCRTWARETVWKTAAGAVVRCLDVRALANPLYKIYCFQNPWALMINSSCSRPERRLALGVWDGLHLNQKRNFFLSLRKLRWEVDLVTANFRASLLLILSLGVVTFLACFVRLRWNLIYTNAVPLAAARYHPLFNDVISYVMACVHAIIRAYWTVR